VIRRWSFAPELPGAAEFQQALADRGVTASAGHSDAIYDDLLAAYNGGLRLITHMYSCTSTITREKGFRRLGVIEFAYLYDDVVVEAIADGCHIPKELFRLLYKIKGGDGICLVSDAMNCCGIDTEFSSIGGVPCKIKNGVACLLDESAFAGSIATADWLVRFCVKDVGLPVAEAVKMITVNPAKVMGLTKKGRLAAGMDADLVIFDEDIRIQKVFVSGKEVAL
jgi:N-acetylglucosamine-6-phosphate deacetylase